MAYNVFAATPEVVQTIRRAKEQLNTNSQFVDQSPSLPPGSSIRLNMNQSNLILPARVISRKFHRSVIFVIYMN